VPKDPNDSALFDIYRAFATEEETAAMRESHAGGIGWGEMKQVLFERINAELKPALGVATAVAVRTALGAR
jgi:tryptophanyl-tRNA synthetase